MDKTLFSALGPFVKSPKLFKAFQDYLDYRIALLHKDLEQVSTESEMKKIQGAIQEIRKLQSLDKIVEGILKTSE